MKNYTRILAVLIAIVAIISLQSCSQDSTPVSSSAQYMTTNIVSDVFASNDLGVVSLEAQQANDDLMAIGGKPEPKAPNTFGPYGFALGQVGMTPEEAAAITTIAQEYVDCVTAATAEIKAAEKAIMDDVKAQVTAIMEQVKAGSLDKAAAREQLKAIQEKAKADLAAIPGRDAAKAAVKDCFTKYDAAVRATLTPDQVALLDKALANKGKGTGKDTGKGNGKDNKGGDKGKGKPVLVEGPLGKVLVGLGLDSNQVKAANDAAKIYRDCYTVAMQPIRDQEKVILDGLKTQRDAIMAEVKAGTKTREEAATAMKEAETQAKAAIAAIPGRTEAEAQAKKCYDTYVATVKTFLTPDQIAKLDAIIKAGGTGTTKP